MILGLLTVDETRAELEQAERELNEILAPANRIVCPERLAEKQASRRWWRDKLQEQLLELEAGQAFVEYVLTISLIALLAFVALKTTGTNVGALLHRIASDL